MSNKCVPDETVRILLDRREELQNRINKDMKEYKAIGDMITRLRRAEEQLKKQNESYR